MSYSTPYLRRFWPLDLLLDRNNIRYSKIIIEGFKVELNKYKSTIYYSSLSIKISRVARI